MTLHGMAGGQGSDCGTSTSGDHHHECDGCDTHTHLFNATGWCRVCHVPKCDTPAETKWDKGALATTYQRDFFNKEVPHDPAKKLPYVPSLAKFAGKSTHQTDFLPKAARVARPRQQNIPVPARPFDDRTTYQAQFPPKFVPQPIKGPAPDDGFKAPFYGSTSYLSDYTKKPLADRQQRAPADAFCGPAFDGQSTYRDDFVPKEVPMRPARQRQPLLPSRHTANGTEYGAEFIEKRVARCSLRCCYNPTHPNSTGGPQYKRCNDCESRASHRASQSLVATGRRSA